MLYLRHDFGACRLKVILTLFVAQIELSVRVSFEGSSYKTDALHNMQLVLRTETVI
jgi:hypothetical protein